VKPAMRRRLGLGVSAFFTAVSMMKLARREGREAQRWSMVSAAAFLIPTLTRNASWWGPVIKTFTTSKKEVWLTLDDGPDAEETPRILDVLHAFQARATFFCIGQRVVERPELVRAMIEAGHDVQNHTFSHPAFSFWAATPRRVREEMWRGSEVLRAVTGRIPTLFRAPAGLANAFVHEVATCMKLRMVGWSVGGHDGISHDPNRVLRRILRRVQSGDIILLHENRLLGMPVGQRAKTLEKLLMGFEQCQLRTIIPEL